MNWQHVDDGFPDEDDIVLVVVDSETWIGSIEGGVWRDLDGLPMIGEITHWAPLPEPATVH
jgi:hypothetical protein